MMKNFIEKMMYLLTITWDLAHPKAKVWQEMSYSMQTGNVKYT